MDYFSSFWEIDFLKDIYSSTIIRKLKGQFAKYGIPDVLITDNGLQFTTEEFVRFSKKWQFDRGTSSPHFHQSNGKAENAVKIAKSLLRKAKAANSDPYLSMLAFRNTPTKEMLSSPAQRLMNRRTTGSYFQFLKSS